MLLLFISFFIHFTPLVFVLGSLLRIHIQSNPIQTNPSCPFLLSPFFLLCFSTYALGSSIEFFNLYYTYVPPSLRPFVPLSYRPYVPIYLRTYV